MKQDHFFVLLLILFFNLLLQSLSEKSNGVCVSPGGRFRPFSAEGKPPRSIRDLTLCRMFRRKTCCDVSHTHSAFLSVRKLASTGEANQECLHLWEVLECSICDPDVGVKPSPPLICTSFCERLFQACSDAYFSMDAITQVLAPCGVGDFVCGRASEWFSNGTELCRATGFAVKPLRDSGLSVEDTSCYGGKASIDSITESWKVSQTSFQEEGKYGLIEDFQQWVTEMAFAERVSWAVGGLVLTAGLFFMSKRKSYSQRQKQAAIIRAARIRQLDFKAGQRQSITQGSRKVVVK
ncbi:folate-binding protein 1 [Amaranthus tricolor]|uniref:folate-binding protein 1 n=1 Tax=Amaranthus tricolor TaxID=29722 RepID=UPI00258DF443|nr:folate-binding protein 1 [Amaranthus tricolor]